MRQAANALTAVPIFLAATFSALVRRPRRARVGFAISLTVVLGVGVFGADRPTPTVATPLMPVVPLTQAEFETTVATDHGLSEPVIIRFTAPMDAASVRAALTVEPDTAVDLAWAPDGMSLAIAPVGYWSAGVLETVTVQAGALSRAGQPLGRPARATFLTRGATTGTATATESLGASVALTTGFVVTFAQPVDSATVRTAIRLDPPTPGIVRSNSPAEDEARFIFQPLAPLLPDMDYHLIVSGVRDADGVPLDTIRLAVHTTTPPGVVRFRPLDQAADVAPSAVLSVRFSQPMDRRSTTRAFSATAGGTVIPGSVRWAERDTVLVFTPTSAMPAGKTVSMDVSTVATNAAGVPLATPGHGVFKTARSASAATPISSPSTFKISSSGEGGSAVGGGSWAAVETYYLGLMNCTRTGGWVTSTGACSSPGGRNVAPLILDEGISSEVSRPYARRLAVGADCSHFIGGNPGDRLRRAGYDSYRWAENLGCRPGSARASVLGSHLFFQSERSSGGGHYVNMMNPKYDRVGIGVWVSGGSVRLVVDFYHP